jgi:hypothetical protein
MALVRRSSMLGQGGQVVAAAVSQAPGQSAIGRAPVHGAPGDGPDGDPPAAVAAVSAGPGGGFAGVSGPGVVGPAMVAAPSGEAAAVPTQPASVGAVLGSLGLVALGGGGAWAIWRSGATPTPIRLGDSTTVFASLFAFATAVERVLEPFSRWLPGRHTRAQFEQAVAGIANRPYGATYQDLTTVAAAKARMDRGRANRTLISWGIATAVSTVGSTAGGFYLLHAIAGPQWNGVQIWVDAIVTGIVVGSGTKPLHDVISRVQKGKEQAEDLSH